MSQDVGRDHLVIIRIDGMHCHKCERTLQKALLGLEGVYEVEVDFPSKQASVLHDRSIVPVKQLMQAVNDAGYTATGFTQRQTASR